MKAIKKKTLITALVLVIATSLVVSAGLLSYFGKVETTMSVQQSVVLDGLNWDEPVTATIEDAVGGCCYCSEHWVENRGCEGIWLEFNEYGVPDMEGVDVNYFLTESCCNHILYELELVVLDGMAEWDDFDVQVDGIDVYSYDAHGGDPETWITHNIDLTPYQIQCCGPHTIRVICTACEPWQQFDPYGQLAVDYAALYCEPDVLSLCCPQQPILCDEVDIGDTSSESGHNLIGWGPIEPATSGGGYGGIDDCRCTWYADDNDQAWASFELTCEDCYDGGGCPEDCETGVPLDMPFYLESGETIDFCICYKLDMLIEPGTYEIYHELIPAILE